MVTRREFTFPAKGDGHPLYGCVWTADGFIKYKGIIQIAHGMEEHILRYEQFAAFLAKQGFVVCGNDHTGHGRSMEHWEDRGFFGEEEGSWQYMIEDMKYVMDFMKKKFANLPYFLIGHSMGSFLAREFCTYWGNELTGSIFMGTSGGSPFLDIAILLSKEGVKLKGTKARGYSVNRLAFGAFNVKFSPKRTNYDWLSSNEQAVNQFLNDDKCGFVFTYAGYRELFMLLKQVSSKEWAEKLPQKLPILLISGKDDPVGDYGKGVEKVYHWLQEAGCENVDIKLYPGGRHELLQETFQKQVYRFILRWIYETLTLS